MSEIRVDNITDEAGTGRPSFPNGIVPIGTTAERPSSPKAGEIRFNTDENEFEGYDGNDWGVIRSDEKQATVPIRQTVLFGPVDSDGRADFIEDTNSGLEVNTEGLDSEALQITVALGFDPGPVNRTVSIDSNQIWTGLADNVVNYLGLRIASDGTITPVHTTSLDYGHTHPSSPSTGDYSFLIPAMRMFRYDGAEWVTDPVVFVGQAETDSGAVVETRSYAYQGKSYINLGSQSVTSTAFNFNHNIGFKDVFAAYYIVVKTAGVGYSVGDKIELLGHGRHSTNSRNSWAHIRSSPVHSVLAGEGAHSIPNKSGGGSNSGGVASSIDADLEAYFWRSF